MSYDIQTLCTVFINTIKAHIRPSELKEIVNLIKNDNSILKDNINKLVNELEEDIIIELSTSHKVIYEVEFNGVMFKGYFIYNNKDINTIIMMHINGLHFLTSPIDYKVKGYNIVISRAEFLKVWQLDSMISVRNMNNFTITQKNS